MSLSEQTKFYFLESYTAILMSEQKPIVFRLQDLSNFISCLLEEFAEKVINSIKKKRLLEMDIFTYFLQTFHRAYEMLEKRNKADFNNEFQVIFDSICSFIALIYLDSESYEITEDSKNSFLLQFLVENSNSRVDELQFFLKSMIDICKSDISMLERMFKGLFAKIYEVNTNPTINVNFELIQIFNSSSFLTNLQLLNYLFKHPILFDFFSSSEKFIVNNEQFRGQFFQYQSNFSQLFL